MVMVPGSLYAQHVSSKSAVQKKEAQKQAQDLQLFQQIYQDGKAHFKKKEYTKAITKFLRAYRIRSNPNLVYNIARSFEELKEYENAAKYYEEYLKMNPQASDRADVELSIQTLKRLHQSQGSKSKASKKTQDHTSPETALSTDLPSPYMEAWGWGLMGVGAVLVGAGLYFGQEASQDDERLSSFGMGDSRQEYLRLQTQRNDNAFLSDLLWIPGVLSVGTGIYLFLSSSKSTSVKKKALKASRLDRPISSSVLDWRWSLSPAHIEFGFSF